MSYNKKTGLYEGYIYLITNKINDKKYVGQTVTTIKNRTRQHFGNYKSKRKYAINLAIAKYGKDNFMVKEIDKISAPTKIELQEILNEKEIFYIQEYHSLASEYGYNLDKGGASCSYFSKPIDVYDMEGNLIKEFDSAHETARYYDVDVNTVLNVCTGKQNRSLKCPLVIFRYHGDAFDKYDTTLIIPNAKKIYQFTLDGRYINEYNGATEACNAIGNIISQTNIHHAARNNKTAGGYVWSYENKFKFKIEEYRNYVSVDKYSTDGKFLGNFKCVTDAGKSLNIDYVKTSCITDVCSGKMLTAYGYVWRYKDEPFDKYRVVSKYQPVNQYSKDNVFIETHNTANQASKKVGLKYSGDIGKCCSGERKTCGGYKWFYANDPNQPDKSKIIA